MKAHRICLYSRYSKHRSARELQTNQPGLMWNLQPPWDTAKISCFPPSPDSIHMLTLEACKALLPKKESFFSCPVFVLHKIWGLAALKGAQSEAKHAGSVQAAEQQLLGSRALTFKSAALSWTWQGCQQHRASSTESLTDRKIRMSWEQGRRNSRGWVSLTWSTTEGLQEAQRVQVDQWPGRGWPALHGQGAWLQFANRATCGLHSFCHWARPVSPSQVDEKHLLV